MKALLVVLIIYTNSAICEHDFFLPAKNYVKRYPKKVITEINPMTHILSSRKYVKSLPEGFQLNTKSEDEKYHEYTVFPIVFKNLKGYGIPDSPYFPLAENIDTKPRVKKVLPDYVFNMSRKKRSIPVKVKSDNNTNKFIKTDTKVKKVPPRKHHVRTKLDNDAKVKEKTHQVEKDNKNDQTANDRLNKNNNVPSYSDATKAKPYNNNLLKSRRLIAARDALIEEYPYVVSIQKSGQHWCSGALLNPRLVITTANCIWKSSRVSRLKVRAGSRHTEHGGQVAKIQEVMKHPKWNIRRNPDNDVALLLLDRNIKFSDTVHGVDLPNRVMLPAFEDVWVTSWGTERRDGVYDSKSMSLQVYHARLLDRAKCNNVTQRFGVTVTDNFFCVAQTGRRAPCTRDTGAPAVSDGVVWGLASWGIRKQCGTERFPAVFSYLASHSNMDFIANATRLLMSDERHYPFPDRFPYVRATVTTSTTVFPF
ncbi:uncharacterized protein ACR2FA_009301 [Aphomia sociella]